MPSPRSPHSSTVPSCTMTLINEGLVHGSASSCVSTLSRICESSTLVATSARLLRLAKACSRFARLTMPVFHDRNALDRVLLEQICDLPERSVGGRGYHLARHHVSDLARMLPY